MRRRFNRYSLSTLAIHSWRWQARDRRRSLSLRRALLVDLWVVRKLVRGGSCLSEYGAGRPVVARARQDTFLGRCARVSFAGARGIGARLSCTRRLFDDTYLAWTPPGVRLAGRSAMVTRLVTCPGSEDQITEYRFSTPFPPFWLLCCGRRPPHDTISCGTRSTSLACGAAPTRRRCRGREARRHDALDTPRRRRFN